MGLLKLLDDGKKRSITLEEYDYYLGALPRVAYNFAWNGEQWEFGFAEGADYIVAFQKQGGKCFAQKTNLLNPWQCGVTLEEQAEGNPVAARGRVKRRPAPVLGF